MIKHAGRWFLCGMNDSGFAVFLKRHYTAAQSNIRIQAAHTLESVVSVAIRHSNGHERSPRGYILRLKYPACGGLF